MSASSDPWEQSAIYAITYADQAAGRELLAVLASTVAPMSLIDVFTTDTRKCVAIAFQAALRGEAQADMIGVMTYLDALPWGQAHAMLSGKAARDDEIDTGSTWDRIGGASAIVEPPGAAPTSAASMRSLATTLRNQTRTRQALALLGKISRAVEGIGAGEPPERMIGQAIDRLGSILGGGTGASLGDHAAEMLAQADLDKVSRTGRKASWSLSDLDAACPFRPGRLYILAAPPGVGKTSLALQAASASGADPTIGHVGIASLEMTGGELAAILIARALRLRPADIREANLDTDDRGRVDAMVTAWQASPSLWVTESGSGAFTVDALAAWARTRHASCGGLSLLIVDYLQLLDGDAKANEYATITKNTRALKRLALSLRIPVLVLSQLSRDGRKETRDRTGHITGAPEPRLSDLRGSGSIEQDADAVVFVHYPGEPAPGATTVEARIIVAKNRGGKQGEVSAQFFRPWQLFQTRQSERAQKLASKPQDSEDVLL